MPDERSPKGEPGDNDGEDARVTPRLPWPREMAHARDEAAEWLAKAIKRLQTLMDGQRRTELEILLALAEVIHDLVTALRWLESCGAQTLPESIEEVRR